MIKNIIKTTKIEELFSVKNKLILISGSGGLGGHLAKGFLENGAYVVLTDVVSGKAQEVKESLAKEGLTQCDAYKMDQTDKAEIQAVVDDIVKKHKAIDVFFNTAALCSNDVTEDFDEAVLRKMLEVNITGTILVTQVVGKSMIPNRQGKIIEIGSIGGLECHSYASMPYESSKAAVHQLTKSFATAWAKYNINVNCIAPTWINTPMLSFCSPEMVDAVVDQHFFGRMSEVEDYMGAALFLASDASNYVSGHVLAVDGAWSVSKPWKL